MSWSAPTLHAHRHKETRNRLQITDDEEIPESELPDPVAICRCGKITTSQMLLDIRGLPLDIKTLCKIPEDMDFICDGCMETVFREGYIAHHDFFKALGCDDDAHERWKHYTKHFPYPKHSKAHEKKMKDKLHPDN